MKRRTKSNIGAWPNMRDDTLKAIAEELIRARQKHPHRSDHVRLLKSYVEEMELAFASNDAERGTAMQIYADAVTIAAMAIRILEEGSSGHRYSGNTTAPAFRLEA